MNLLALDTSTEYLSLAILKGEALYTFDVNAGQSHSQIILPQLQLLLAEAGLQLHDLQGIAFGAGPGSFTGVRIAAGVVQGLALGANLPILPVCTLEALAETSGLERVVACLDARMGEIYHAVYDKTAHGWCVQVPPSVCKPEAAPAFAGQDYVGVGSGWQTYSTQLSALYSSQITATQPEALPTATAILQIAKSVFAAGKGLPAIEANPIYIRNRVALKSAERAQGLKL